MDPVLDSVPQRGTALSATPAPASQPSSPLRPLWAAIGVLGVAVVALGGTLVYQQGRDSGTPVAAQSAAAMTAPGASGPVVTAPPTTLAQAALAEEKMAQTQTPPAPAAPKSVAKPVTRPVASSAPAPAPYYGSSSSGGYSGSYGTAQPVVQAAAPVCTVCGRVEAVNVVSRPAPASGVGAVAGGVLGAVVGNQIGNGNGRTAATLLGAAGGGYLGHTIEQRTRSTTSYVVQVRMDDGSRRTFERSQPVPVGERVTVEGNSFRLGRGATYSTYPSDPGYRQVSQSGTYATGGY
ncbi:glycine zipper 2TM domain-containing protein [uncultured Xylophilus sp.]|uniref:glycine zipper 2TM domain-containing protein n=1 Tax=uncultured Xylophilus sp. TaxID=296832 RepID=UPI0025EA0C58|nr:glycine zipper 2TM domain-containing protein [uncultured Xylophilus sp.]